MCQKVVIPARCVPPAPGARPVNKGFTLIELLVVVLIIGILAAIAVPQYERAVWRSRNAGLKSLLKTLASAQEAYYMANGAYATQFEQLDIDFPLKKGSGGWGACRLATDGSADSVRVGDNMQLILGTYAGVSSVFAVWTEGKYKCTGFSIRSSLDETKRLECLETRNGTNTIKPGEFCINVEHGVLEYEGNSMLASRYVLP